mmetsp:Transcript_19441/g.46981  ORF Transcript_19441/g.46981 Transcript_19441/m.46981 type:complete len:110 (+) Transcript_19441:1652-1981(+)
MLCADRPTGWPPSVCLSVSVCLRVCGCDVQTRLTGSPHDSYQGSIRCAEQHWTPSFISPSPNTTQDTHTTTVCERAYNASCPFSRPCAARCSLALAELFYRTTPLTEAV